VDEDSVQPNAGEPDPSQFDPFTNEAEQPVWENIGGDH
jgi:hypothetical protein